MQVASFLYYQEKMNVLVEPDVHDIFARIPGFGFIQTFYNQNSRYRTLCKYMTRHIDVYISFSLVQ